MNEQLFWEMSRDGRLEGFAQRDPLEFTKACELLIEEVIKTDEPSLRQYESRLYIKINDSKYNADRRLMFAREAPEVFELWRNKLLSATINLARDKERLVRLQWRTDVEIKRHAHSLGACVAIISLMNESFYKLNEVLNNPSLKPSHTDSSTAQKHDCEVLAFKGKDT